MTAEHDKAWRAALKKERGIDAGIIESKIIEAWEHPNIPNDDVEDAKIAFQRSYLLFAQSVNSGNAMLRELSMTEGQRAFDCGKLLHTKLTLEPEVARDRAAMKVRRGPRSSKMPLLDAWLTQKLQSRDVSNKVLWKSLPSHDNDEAKTSVYRDGEDCVCERDGDKVRETTYKGFENRATTARKARSPISD